jgi:hypothetical protein
MQTNISTTPASEDLEHADALDQAAGEEGWSVHAQHMPLQDEGGVAEGQAADVHRQRRGRHQQVHGAVAQRGGQHGDDEGRLAGDLGQRPARALLPGIGHLRHAQAAGDQQGDDGEDRERGIGGGELDLPDVARDLARPGADEAAEDAAGQRPGDRLRLPVGRRHVGGGEAVLQAEGVVGAGAQVPRHSSQKLPMLTAAAQVMPPRMPSRAPTMKPARRP